MDGEEVCVQCNQRCIALDIKARISSWRLVDNTPTNRPFCLSCNISSLRSMDNTQSNLLVFPCNLLCE